MQPLTQAVIMVAGASTRTYPLTVDLPKPLLPIANKPLLQHLLEQLRELVDNVILIVGFEHEQVRQAFGTEFRGMTLTYVEQTEQLGTGHALKQALPYIHDRFFLLYGDDLIHRSDLERLRVYPYAVLCAEVPDPRPFNVLDLDEDGYILRINEKPKTFTPGALSSFSPYILEPEVAHAVEAIPLSPRGEYELVDIADHLPGGQHLKAVEMQAYWLPVGYPWKLLEANRFLLEHGAGTDLEIPNVMVKAPVLIGKDTTLEAGCTLGPGTTLGSHCHIAEGTRLLNCVVMDNVQIGPGCHLEDSIVMNNVTIAAGVTTLTHAPDGGPIYSHVKGQPFNTGRHSLGAVLGHHVSVGAGCRLHPGVKIWPGANIPAGREIKEDVVG